MKEVFISMLPTLVSSLLASLTSFLVMWLTLRSQGKNTDRQLEQQAKEHSKNLEIQIEQLKKSEEHHRESAEREQNFYRVSQLPYLYLKYDTCTTDEQGNIFWFILQNLGNGAALDIKISEKPVRNCKAPCSAVFEDQRTGTYYTYFNPPDAVSSHKALPVGQTDKFALRQNFSRQPLSDTSFNLDITVTYKDTYYNDYKQDFKIEGYKWESRSGARTVNTPLPELQRKETQEKDKAQKE